MPAVYVSKGLEKCLKAFCDYVLGETAQVNLYTNDYTPVYGSDQSNFTQATFPGYAAVNLARNGVEHEKGDGSHWQQDWAEVTFTRTTAGAVQTCYGYYVYAPGIGVFWAERFGAPTSVAAAGEKIQFSMYTTTKSEA